MRKWISLILAICLVAVPLMGCDSQGGTGDASGSTGSVTVQNGTGTTATTATATATDTHESSKEQNGIHLLSFSQTQSVEEMKKIDGKKVSMIGYMSTLSPISGKFMYLMHLPYQSCPFCVPNTTQLSNTIAVYAKNGDEFEFTDRAITVTGTLEFGSYTDEFGYEYAYRIKDATYEILNTDKMDEKLRLWQQLASTNVISEIYTMYEYVNFLCYWPTYTVEFTGGKDYLYPADAVSFVEKDGAQFNYGFKNGYFDDLKAKVKSVDPTAFADLIQNIEDAEALASRAYAELKAGNCTKVTEYSNAFKDGRAQYKINASAELEAEMTRIYRGFSEWLSGWEL